MSEWLPIESAPRDDGVAVLVWTPFGGVAWGRWSDEHGAWWEPEAEVWMLEAPTHWRPLPAPPESE